MFHYEMDGKKYILVDDIGKIHWAGEEIAVAFSFTPNEKISGTLHKHGSIENVNKWANVARIKLASIPEMAAEITVVFGKIPLEELDNMISISGYVGRWYERMLNSKDNTTTVSTSGKI